MQGAILSTMLHERFENLRLAVRALMYAWQHELSIKLQVFATLIVSILGLYFKITLTEWIPLIMSFGMVLAIELMNTALENICDTVHPDYDFHIGIAKDLGASASFVAGLIAAFVSIGTFLPQLV